jgi:hypothetical protein
MAMHGLPAAPLGDMPTSKYPIHHAGAIVRASKAPVVGQSSSVHADGGWRNAPHVAKLPLAVCCSHDFVGDIHSRQHGCTASSRPDTCGECISVGGSAAVRERTT